MGKNWKRWFAIGLAVLAGCMIPMGTMKASEEEQSVSQNSIVGEARQMDLPEEVPEDMLEEVPDTIAAGDALSIFYPEASGNIDLMGGTDVPVSYDAYIGRSGAHALMVTADEGVSDGSYCLLQDKTSVTQQDLESCSWTPVQGWQIPLEGVPDGKYVACVRAYKDGSPVYAVSRGFVSDITAPRIVDGSGQEMIGGNVYDAGTKFTVLDTSPVTVYMNDDRSVPVQPVDGQYTVTPKENSDSCIIVARDAAKNETTLSITIKGGSDIPGPEDPVKITESKTCSLQESTAYVLGEGTWKVAGDNSVYPGGITFYVPSGSYTFQKQ